MASDPGARLPCFESDPYRAELDGTVTSAGDESGRPFALLADTIFYPEGGGQPADRGQIGDAAVLDVQRVGGEIRHYLDRPVAPGPVRLRLDWERRFDHMQQHTGQHLLSAVAEDRFGFPTTSFHLGPELCDVELLAPALSPAVLAKIGEAVAAEVRAARPVRVRRVTAEEYDQLSLRSRGLPEGHQGDVRLIEIEGVDLNTCGGTHVASTAAIEVVALLRTEPMRGGTRLTFVAGGRARARLAAAEGLSATLRARLGVPDEGIVAALAARIDQARDAARREKVLAEELARARAEALALGPETVIDQHYAALDPSFLAALGRSLATLAPGKCALLTAGSPPEVTFVVVAGAGTGIDAQDAGREVATRLGGRGGGRGELFQGKASSLIDRAGAVALLRARGTAGGSG